MALDITTPDNFLIGLSNYAIDSYSKNGTDLIGGYASRIAYCWESLLAVDLSGISGGSTIDAVTIDVNVTANNNVGANSLTVHENTLAAWTDNGSSEPDRDTPTAFNSGTLPTALSSSTTFVGTGLKTIPSSANLVSLFQDFLDSVKDPADGVFIAYYTDYFGYYLTQDEITVNVTYTAGGGGPTRRIFIT